MTKTDPTLGAAMRRLRKDRGLTQEDLAYTSDMTVSALSRIERGRSNPTWASVRAIAATLDVSLRELSTAIEEGDEIA